MLCCSGDAECCSRFKQEYISCTQVYQLIVWCYLGKSFFFDAVHLNFLLIPLEVIMLDYIGNTKLFCLFLKPFFFFAWKEEDIKTERNRIMNWDVNLEYIAVKLLTKTMSHLTKTCSRSEDGDKKIIPSLSKTWQSSNKTASLELDRLD